MYIYIYIYGAHRNISREGLLSTPTWCGNAGIRQRSCLELYLDAEVLVLLPAFCFLFWLAADLSSSPTILGIPLPFSTV